RRAWETGDIEIVAINNLTDNKTLAHLLKYDSSYGTFKPEVTTEGDDYIVVDGKKIRYLQERDPEKLPWKDLGVDIVLESTGVFDDVEGASKHIKGGAKKVIVTAVCKGTKNTYCMGVNEGLFKAEEAIISNASCTTNCMAPVMKVLHENLKVKRALMTTVHSYTNDQNIQDLPHKDLRRARAAALNIIPTTTGAATAVAMVIPELEGKMNGFSVRVPTPTVSLLDIVAEVEKPTTKEELNELFKKAAKGPLKGILDYSDMPLVSMDYKGNIHSAVVDGLSTMVIEGTLVKVVAWYDNEWGYSCRVIDLAKMVAAKL
ncbi:MAG TPA: type I glyceraldehyde-3-phosphate dehydrogenase, partial [Candidatus Gracilibacteria bacterium]|nr:type I glyceraldehyde-3-phosphate dehydrogenase [Candidatus Gracilibacteria bacterium]